MLAEKDLWKFQWRIIIAQGMHLKSSEIAKRILMKNMSVDLIAKTTDLTIAEVKALKKEPEPIKHWYPLESGNPLIQIREVEYRIGPDYAKILIYYELDEIKHGNMDLFLNEVKTH